MKTLKFYNNSRACCICVYCTRQVFALAAWEEKSPFSVFSTHFYSVNEKHRAQPRSVFIYSFPTDLPFIVLTVVHVRNVYPNVSLP